MKHRFFSEFMRDIIFGIEDGLISIMGLVVGVAAATQSTSAILISAAAGTVAAAISMSAGDYLSTKSEKEVLMSQRKNVQGKHLHPLMSALVIGGSFLAMSAIPIGPYLLFTPSLATPISIGATFATLFAVGALKCMITKRNWLVSGLEMVIVAGLAAGAGYLIGNYFAVSGI